MKSNGNRSKCAGNKQMVIMVAGYSFCSLTSVPHYLCNFMYWQNLNAAPAMRNLIEMFTCLFDVFLFVCVGNASLASTRRETEFSAAKVESENNEKIQQHQITAIATKAK